MSVTKDEFIQLQKSVARRENRRLWVLLTIGWGLPVALVIGGTEVLGKSGTEDFLVSLVTVNRHLLLAGFGVLGLVLILAVIATARNPGGMKCPKCGKSISSRITMLTSNCGHCGERIIA